MPTLEDNKHFWDGRYDWSGRGDEWSAEWGGPDMQWYGTLLPRIHPYLPTGTIVEIACGCGRWTRYLKDLGKRVVAVDLSRRCVEVCRERFAAFPQVECHLNDGRSLAMVPDASVDFVFSFDSLVHADASVIDAYLGEIARVLRREGVAFIHHSNLGEYRGWYDKIHRLPWLEKALLASGFLEAELHGRDFSVDAAQVEALARRHRLACIAQEIVGTGRIMLDCLSTLVRQDSGRLRRNRVLRNPGFVAEKRNLARLARLYSRAGG